MNKKIIKLIILRSHLICQKLDDNELKYEVIRNCLNHYINDEDLENTGIYNNNLSRRKIMGKLGELFMNGTLDKKTYLISINFLITLFEYYNKQNIKNKTY